MVIPEKFYTAIRRGVHLSFRPKKYRESPAKAGLEIIFDLVLFFCFLKFPEFIFKII